jgi:CheY-like chemotaxis protein
MVYGIVVQSGGTIDVISELGVGSTFEVLLPRVAQQLPSISSETIVESRLPVGPETILLVEDEDMVRSLLAELLSACGYNVLEASDGLSGVALYQKHSERIDLLLTDLVMPKMGGREVAEKLHEENPDLPVLFISGYTDDDIVRGGVESSDVRFLQKPFTLEEVSRTIRQLLDEKESSR